VIAVSMSVMTFTEIEFANCHPTPISCAVVPSCARSIAVIESPDWAVTRTISAFVCVGATDGGQTVALYGGDGCSAPPPAASVNVSPVSAGDGAVATVVRARLACWSKAVTAAYLLAAGNEDADVHVPRSTNDPVDGLLGTKVERDRESGS
jgi:hypothetical protein